MFVNFFFLLFLTNKKSRENATENLARSKRQRRPITKAERATPAAGHSTQNFKPRTRRASELIGFKEFPTLRKTSCVWRTFIVFPVEEHFQTQSQLSLAVHGGDVN